MDQIIIEIIKVSGIGPREIISFFAVWYLLHKEINSLRKEIRSHGESLREVETSHAKQLSLLHQDHEHTKIKVHEIAIRTEKFSQRNNQGECYE